MDFKFRFRGLSQFLISTASNWETAITVTDIFSPKNDDTTSIYDYFQCNHQHKTQYHVMKIRKYWKMKWKKKSLKKVSGPRGVWTHDPWIRRWTSYHWAKILIEKLEPKLMNTFPNKIWKISVFSARCRHFWIFFANLD